MPTPSPQAAPDAAPSAAAPSRFAARALAVFRVIAAFEAFTWAGLLVGMFFKYIAVGNEIGVQVFGPLHGAAFIAYVAVALLAWRLHRWSLWTGLIGLAASVPPFGTVVFERMAGARGYLEPHRSGR